MTQDEIARHLSLSRASVARMLDRARKSGIVTIGINAESLTSMELSSTLRSTFGLSEALVIPTPPNPSGSTRSLNARIGLGGAQLLTSYLAKGTTLGVGFGETVSEVIRGTSFPPLGQVELVTLTGGVDGYLRPFMSSNPDPTRASPTTASVMPSPIVASSAELAQSLKQEPTIKAVLEKARAVDVAVVGIGTPTSSAVIVEMGLLDSDGVDILLRNHVVGDILGQFFDSEGRLVDLHINRMRIGIELDELKRIPRVIGVAGGIHKVDAILAAVKGSHLDVLVTDEAVARELLRRYPQ
ncbi:sugar-binding transcriptional regulator [uncultured Microbacterium sp.]|uniref:sugar-binding transcriptional regulator n=1 Tax=uncultured Microbacterium sp. TaxID=191216 RepID=UPI0035CA4BBD